MSLRIGHRALAAASAILLLCGCASRPAAWRVANGVLTPPATLKRMSVPLCGAKQKLSPAEALELRSRILRSEDDGCVPAGTAERTIARAIEHLALPSRRAFELRFGSARDHNYMDLAPGWRLRSITPILKSGGFRLPSTTAPAPQQPGATIEIRTEGEFLGMETAFYRVAARDRQDGVRIQLESVEAVIDGKPQPREKPLASLFGLPADARHIRIIYLTRRSENDHDMAVVGGPTYRSLDEHARCDGTPYCVWVPLGIAVLPQMPVTVNGSAVWVPIGATVRDAIGREISAELSVLRAWRGKPIPVRGEAKELGNLVLMGGESIATRR